MQRTMSYRGLEIYIELRPTSKDMFEPWLRIDGPSQDARTAAFWHSDQGSRRPVFTSLGLPRRGDSRAGVNRPHSWSGRVARHAYMPSTRRGFTVHLAGFDG